MLTSSRKDEKTVRETIRGTKVIFASLPQLSVVSVLLPVSTKARLLSSLLSDSRQRFRAESAAEEVKQILGHTLLGQCP